MKNLYLIGGTMGVGKTTTCQIIKNKLDRSVFLDGDWCWDMHPFLVTEETKEMVVGNICFLLNSFIKCSLYDHIVFCWVMHQQAIIDDIVSRLDTEGCRVHALSLVCNEKALETRLRRDVEAGIRSEDVVHNSIARLPLYEKLDTHKVDVSEISAEHAADYIIHHYE